MILKIEKTFELQEPIEQVWALWSDVVCVASCMPGVHIDGQTDEWTFLCTIGVKFGSAISDYQGKLRIESVDRANHAIEIVGEGGDASGRDGGSLSMTAKLMPSGNGTTRCASVCTLNFRGVLEQMGMAALREGTNHVFEEFAHNFRKRMRQPDQPLPKPRPIDATSLAIEVVKGLIGGKS